jgi:vitamin B12 transporter
MSASTTTTALAATQLGASPGAYIVPEVETKLKASYGTGFKAPTLQELYVNYPPFFFANPNLQPEENEGFEQPLLNDRIRFGATYYHLDFTNLIDCTTNTCLNIGKAVTYGAESFASFAITRGLNVRVDYICLIARNEITDQELLRRSSG